MALAKRTDRLSQVLTCSFYFLFLAMRSVNCANMLTRLINARVVQQSLSFFCLTGCCFGDFSFGGIRKEFKHSAQYTRKSLMKKRILHVQRLCGNEPHLALWH